MSHIVGVSPKGGVPADRGHAVDAAQPSGVDRRHVGCVPVTQLASAACSLRRRRTNPRSESTDVKTWNPNSSSLPRSA